MKVGRTLIALMLYVASLVVLTAVAAAHSHGRTPTAVVVFAEFGLVAAFVAFVGGLHDPRKMGVGRFLVRLLLLCAGAALAGGAVLAVASAAGVATALAGGLAAQLVVFSFALLMGMIFAFVRCWGAELLLAQLVCLFVACVLVGTVFYADPIIEAQKTPEARSRVITVALALNPITAVSRSLLGVDLLRRPVMYDRISVIGRWYQTPYGTWWKTACGYLAASVVMMAGAAAARRPRSSALES